MTQQRPTERRSWIRRPALHFVLLGLLAWVLSNGLARSRPAQREVILIGAARIEALARQDMQRTGERPDEARVRALVAAEVDDEILFREALRAGRQRSDPVVYERLVRNMRFLGLGGDDSELFERALELGMHRSDVVVRRRLVQIMRLMLAIDGSIGEVDDSDVRAHLERNAQRFMTAARVRLNHLFFDAGQRGESVERDALAALADLRSPAASATSKAIGDPLLLASSRMDVTLNSLQDRLGDEVASAAATLPPQQWSEPLRSSYGLHLIRVRERIEPRMPDLSTVRNRIEFEILNERRQRAVEGALLRMREEYDVRVAEPAGFGATTNRTNAREVQ